MNKVIILLVCLGISTSVWSDGKTKCKKNYQEVSCSEVEGAKREYFCAKGSVKEKKIIKACKAQSRKKKAKK